VVLSLALLPSPVFAVTQTAEVLPAPDLTVSPADISLAPEDPIAGQPVNITAIIHNIGNATARNITVDFYIDSTSGITKEIDEIQPGSQKSVSINNYIFLSAGSHTITVKIDADNRIIEENEGNNNAVVSVHAFEEETGCFIATAAYGTPTAEEIEILRNFRDEILIPNSAGEILVNTYYDVSPPLAEFIAEHDTLRTIVRVGIIEPMVRTLEFSEDIWKKK
jgi:subtilase family serine protease